MSATSDIRFSATLLRPADRKESWTFLRVPKAASEKLPTRSMTSVEGTFNGIDFQATLEPDGEGSHWLKVDKKLSEAAKADVGDVVKLTIAPAKVEPEPNVPPDLKKALAASPKAMTTWKDTTAVARRDWIAWITSGKKAETRPKRIDVAISKLESGKKRACCFDRSGMYGNSLSCPLAEGEEVDMKALKKIRTASAKKSLDSTGTAIHSESHDRSGLTVPLRFVEICFVCRPQKSTKHLAEHDAMEREDEIPISDAK